MLLQNGQYFLDSSSDSSQNEYFASLDELVVFGMAHELKIAGEEVQLHHPIPCEGSVHAKLLGPLRSEFVGQAATSSWLHAHVSIRLPLQVNTADRERVMTVMMT